MTVSLVGEVFVDFTIDEQRGSEPKMRLGGVVHAARTLWALNVDYRAYVLCPAYLMAAAKEYLMRHGCVGVELLGTVVGTPMVMVSTRPREIGDQRYEFMLRDDYSVTWDERALSALSGEPGPVLVLSGEYSLQVILDHTRIAEQVILDTANAAFPLPTASMAAIRNRLSYITSTSGKDFRQATQGCGWTGWESYARDILEFKGLASRLVLKENRGGARLYQREGPQIEVPAFPVDAVHSIGVGDAFAATFTTQISRPPVDAMLLASAVAGAYAATTYPDDFYSATQAALKASLGSRGGVRVPWERRPEIKIYIAGADFDYEDTQHIERVEEMLRYHNFSPVRPVKECGQARAGMNEGERRRMYLCDLQHLHSSSIVIGVANTADPGMFAEIGMAAAWEKSVLLYDPLRIVNNLFVINAASGYVLDEGDLIDRIFAEAQKCLEACP